MYQVSSGGHGCAQVGALERIRAEVYFQLQTHCTPVHLALLDQISACHQLLHPQVLQLLVKLLETQHSQLDAMEQLKLKKTLLDRLVHLLSQGHVLPVVTYIRRCLEKGDTDVSLIRYFVTEVLDVIAPPYTSDFVQLFLPILENDSIAGTIIKRKVNSTL